MKNLFYSCCFFSLNFFVFSQNPKELSVEFSYGNVNAEIQSLNDYFQSEQFEGQPWEISSEERKIKEVQNVSFGLNYQISDAISFGVQLNHSYSSLLLPLSITFEPEPNFPEYNYTITGVHFFRVSTIGFLGGPQIQINKFLRFIDSNSMFLENMEICAKFLGGVSANSFEERYNFEMYEGLGSQFKSMAFQGRAEIGIGYRFGKSIFSVIGMKVGYQYLKTGNVRNYSDNRLRFNTIEQPKYVSLDFSGIYYGVYLKFGK